jgi:hypothetical protein
MEIANPLICDSMAEGVNCLIISNLMRGKIEVFGLDMLVNMLATAGLRVTVQVKKMRLGFNPASQNPDMILTQDCCENQTC